MSCEQQSVTLTLEQQWSLLIASPQCVRAEQHFVQYAYSRLIPVRILPSTSHSELIRLIAERECNDTSDYRFLNMSGA